MKVSAFCDMLKVVENGGFPYLVIRLIRLMQWDVSKFAIYNCSYIQHNDYGKHGLL